MGDIVSIKKWHISGFVFVSILGVLFHFTYKFFENGSFWGYFFPVNESIWEHLKLIFWPSVLFMIPEYIFIGKTVSDYFSVKASSLFVSMSFIVSAYYTYSGVLGFNLLAADILLFFIGVFIYEYLSCSLIATADEYVKSDNFRGIALLVLFAICFIFWTYNPPTLGIFWG